MILKSGKIFSCFAFANILPYCDMWLTCLSRATTPHLLRFSKSTWYIINKMFSLSFILESYFLASLQWYPGKVGQFSIEMFPINLHLSAMALLKTKPKRWKTEQN